MRVGDPDPRRFLESGRESAQEIADGFAAAGCDLFDQGRVLDFGCGCGRVARHLAPRMRGGEYHGCDVDAPAVAWLAEHIPAGQFVGNRFAPPLPYPDGFFDAVFSLSILTHLDRELQLDWLRELRRVLRPGGTALLSIHAHAAAARTWWGQGLSENGAEQINRLGTRLEDERFFFVGYDDLESREKYAGVAPSYGNSFQSHAYTHEEWGRILDVEQILPAAIVGYQDLVIARRRAEGPSQPR